MDSGVYIDEVQTGSSAEFGGVLPGDIIVKANDSEINTFEDLRKVLNFVKIGDTLKLKILRDNKYQTLRVKLRQSL